MSGAADVVTILVALIGAGATVTASVISTRGAKPAPVVANTPFGVAPTAEDRLGRAYDPAAQRPKVSRAFWWGLASCVAWIIPIFGYITTIIGFYYGIRDIRTPESRRLALVGLILCVLAFVACLINSAYGAAQGAAGHGWWQQ